MKELSAPEGLPFRYRYSSPTQNTKAPQTNVSIVAKCTFSQATKWLTHRFFGDTEDIPSAVNYSALGLRPRAH